MLFVAGLSLASFAVPNRWSVIAYSADLTCERHLCQFLYRASQ